MENENYRQDLNPQGELPPISSEVRKWFPIPEPGEVNLEARLNLEDIVIPDRVIEDLQRYVLHVLSIHSGYSKDSPDGVIIGLSGGIDSSTVAALLDQTFKQKSKHYHFKGIILGRAPAGEQGEMNNVEWEDVRIAHQFAQNQNLDYEYFNISSLVDNFYKLFPKAKKWELSGVLPRIRFAVLQQYADNNNFLLADSTNFTEWTLAAFTSSGSAGSVGPLVDLYKSEVFALGKKLGMPDYVLQKKPAISELGIYDEQLYGGDYFILDPILKRLVSDFKTPREIADELGHSVNWINRIKTLRIEGEQARKIPSLAIFNERYIIVHPPIGKIDRSYFDRIGKK